MSEIDELEQKIKKGKKRAEKLRHKKAEKKAKLEEAQRQLAQLKEAAEEKGIDLGDIDEEINELQSTLNGRVATYMQALDEAEERFEQYEEEE